MCSVGDDHLEDEQKFMPEKAKPSGLTKCNKCKEGRPIVVLRSKDKYCQECFLAGTVHKFKATLGKHKLIRPNDRVLLVHMCGQPTTALLHFVRTGLDLETHKKLRFEATILFIEDHANLSVQERQDLILNVESEAMRFKFPLYLTSMAKLISSNEIQNALETDARKLELKEDDKDSLNNFHQQNNITNKNDYLKIFKQNQLIEIAKYLKCKFIFTPEISSDVATQLLTDISLGRGSQVSFNTGFCDNRDEAVMILRPLRMLDAKELCFYNFLHKLEPVTYKITLNNPHRSVQDLIKKFVHDLQDNYPATVTTIVKTSDKLSSVERTTENCKLCKAPLVAHNSQLSSGEATQFSHWMSTRSRDTYKDVVDSFNNLKCDTYCYSCEKLNK